MTWSPSAPARRIEIPHAWMLEAAGISWVVAAALLVTAEYLDAETSLPSGLGSTTQVAGVVALWGAVLGIVCGFAALARLLARFGDRLGAALLWSAAAGIPLLGLLGLGAMLLVPALLGVMVRGRLGVVRVRRQTAAVLGGMVLTVFTIGWPADLDWPILFYVLRFLVGSVGGVALIWFARRTSAIG